MTESETDIIDFSNNTNITLIIVIVIIISDKQPISLLLVGSSMFLPARVVIAKWARMSADQCCFMQLLQGK